MPETRASKYAPVSLLIYFSTDTNFSIRFHSPDNTVTTSFATTPLTSTYLIAFIVSDFKFVENSATSGLRHRVYANPIDYKTGEFAVAEGERILNAIANYLQVPFSLPKMDQVAIPDFSAGGNHKFSQIEFFVRWQRARLSN